MSQANLYSAKRYSTGGVSCPACRAIIQRNSQWCERCGFTGEKSIDIFGESPPPLLPILDAVGILTPPEKKKITKHLATFNKRFPQFHWKICIVNLPPESRPSLFGFWLMNVCPLVEDETWKDREWTVLLLIDHQNQTASIIPGYQSEVWLSDEHWEKALISMEPHFSEGHIPKAIRAFTRTTKTLLEASRLKVLKLKKECNYSGI